MLFQQPIFESRVLRAVLRLAESLFCAAILLAVTTPVCAQDYGLVQRDTYGETGLLEMPSARMAPDGQLAITLSAMNDMQRGTLSFQILPWLEGSFRYTRIGRWVNSPDYDRSFGLKLRLFEEGEYTPEISVGIRDLVGTGIYGGEYVVVSKQFLDFDVTAGLGWGRLASSGAFANPFAQIFPSFRTRKVNGSVGGQVDVGAFFHGADMGVFGGVVWHTPIENLNLTLEYGSDRYQRERSFGGFKGKSPLNLGLTYAPTSGVTISAGWFYGYSYGAVLTFSTDPTLASQSTKVGTSPLPVSIRTDAERVSAVSEFVSHRDAVERGDDRVRISGGGTIENAEIIDRTLLVDVHVQGRARQDCSAYGRAAKAYGARIDNIAVTDLDDSKGRVVFCAVPKSKIVEASYKTEDDAPFDASAAEAQIRADAKAQGIRVEALTVGPQELMIYYSNHRYEFEAEAIGRLVRVLMADAPASVEAFHLVPVVSGEPTQDILLLRAPLERMFNARGSPGEIGEAISLKPAPLDNPVLDEGRRETYPRFSWAVAPSLREGLFDPTSPIRLQAYLSVSGAVEMQPGFSLEGAFEANIYNTFTTKTPSVSVLPHVRSDVAQYLTKGQNGIAALDIAYRTRVAPDVFVEAKAGYLEDMFAGFGAQVLWRPEGGRWALGADIYDVWQRDFDRLFGWQNYHVLTGHMSIYYQSPWHGINVNLHAGRYLAGDNGVTIEVTRRFATGVEVGAFATFTNVPFSQFGEGSFDKGIMLRIPFEWALPLSTQSSYNLTLRPLTRDGGQRLANDDSLYDETRRTSYDEITQHPEFIADP